MHRMRGGVVTNRSTVLARLAGSVAPSARPAPRCPPVHRVRGHPRRRRGAITLASTRPERLTVSTSNGTSARIEDLQDVLGEGPGQEAFREGRAVVTHVDGDLGGPFPMFTELAGDIAGPLTVWAIPMHPGGTTIGVITLYRSGGSLDESLDDAQFLADAVGAALLDDTTTTGHTPFAAWSDRARVHQATGMVVAQLAIAPDDALAILRAHAFAETRRSTRSPARSSTDELSFTDTHQGVSHDEAAPDDSTGSGGR